MKILPIKLKHSGYDLEQVERTDKVAIYRKSKPGYHNDHFEAIVIRTAPARTFPNGQSIEERECFPSSEQWGTYGWSVQTIEEARAKLSGV